jgi:phosphoribosylglycinamide formyltransferase-1
VPHPNDLKNAKGNLLQRIAIFASGTGSNARQLIEYFQGHAAIEVDLVVSNKARAPVLAMAADHGVDTLVISRHDFYETEKLLATLRGRGIGFIVLAGFLWLIPSYLVKAYAGRMVNIHPALLPAYGGKGMYGMHVHRAVKAAGEPESGITIHWVNEHYDEGDIIFQARCELDPDDEPEDIARKVQQLEHRHFAPVVEQLLTKGLRS